MIVTLTPNPSVDVTFAVPSLVVGEVNRVTSRHRDPAGKGINVTRALCRNGGRSIAVFPADVENGEWIADALRDADVPVATTRIRRSIRENLTIVGDDGTTTKINEPGPVLEPAELDELVAEVGRQLADRPGWLVVAGSLPRGMAPDVVVRLGVLAHEFGARFAVDTSGPALGAVARSGVADLLKPNHEELEELAGRLLATYGEIERFARGLIAREGAAILVSLGSAGALLVLADRLIWAGHAPVVPVSTVGAGDCTLAGYLHADESLVGVDDPAPLRLATAVAWGAAAVLQPGTAVPGPTDIDLDRVAIDLDPDRTTTVREFAR